ncbi:MAG: sigma-70 family RNA polymerase sigma factor [Muribaculaceae bacterium]|nr:sigma-70 family RNA polymerase sigma factor [Muribaculaceae bacterium]
MKWSEQIFNDFKRGKIDSFYTHIYPDILIYATTLLKGKEAFKAEDCVQDAIEASYIRRHEFTSSTQWRAYIVTCVRNRAFSILRHNEAQTNYLENLDPNFEMTPDALNDFIELETRIHIYNAIASLPKELQQIFVLNFEEGLKNSEIAERLGLAEITVKKRKARLLSRLREILGNDFYFFLLFV